jgi:hypothetical protein
MEIRRAGTRMPITLRFLTANHFIYSPLAHILIPFPI